MKNLLITRVSGDIEFEIFTHAAEPNFKIF